MPQHPALASVFSSISLGEPIVSRGWSLFPMFPIRRPEARMISMRAAVLRGLARVEERADAASVRELCVHNLSGRPVLVRDGDLFVAGKQDRVADRPMLLAEGAATEIPVSCVEAGRWAHGERADFGVPPYDADLSLRYSRRADTAEGGRPDQDRTWARVAEHRSARGFDDLSGSLVASQAVMADDLVDFVEDLSPVYGATGLALCRSTERGPRVAEVAWYADPALCEETWIATVVAAVTSLPTGPRPPKISRMELRGLFSKLASSAVRRDGDLLSLRFGRTEARAVLSQGAPAYFNALHV